jgi:ABC-type transporter Mla MlaB component
VIRRPTVTFESDCLFIKGDLTFSTILIVWKASLPYLIDYKELKIDLSQVGQINSAAVALLIEWSKFSRKKGQVIHFINIPPKINHFFEAFGLSPQYLQA